VLQQLVTGSSRIDAADGAAGPVSRQQVLPGPAQLPRRTLLELSDVLPGLLQTDIARVLAYMLQQVNFKSTGVLVVVMLPVLRCRHDCCQQHSKLCNRAK